MRGLKCVEAGFGQGDYIGGDQGEVTVVSACKGKAQTWNYMALAWLD